MLYCQLLNPDLVMDNNTTNFLDLLLNNNKEDINFEISNYDDLEKIRPEYKQQERKYQISKYKQTKAGTS